MNWIGVVAYTLCVISFYFISFRFVFTSFGFLGWNIINFFFTPSIWFVLVVQLLCDRDTIIENNSVSFRWKAQSLEFRLHSIMWKNRKMYSTCDLCKWKWKKTKITRGFVFYNYGRWMRSLFLCEGKIWVKSRICIFYSDIKWSYLQKIKSN